jgi:outer membrane protein OmpA-like peptidoglycan-associated protein
MIARMFIYAAGCTMALALGGASFARAEDCAALITRFDQAIKARQPSAAKDAEARIAASACGGTLLQQVQQRRVKLQLLLAEALKNDPQRAAERETLIVDADKPEVFWLAAYSLGDLRFTQRRFPEATRAFDRAIEIVKDASKTPTPPSAADTRELAERANVARMLAANEENGRAEFVAPAKDHRDGTVGGAFSQNLRSISIKTVPLPINFVTASAKPTEVGIAASKELLAAIREQKPAEVILVGHTDERGSDDYNMRLSRSRVEWVASFLRQSLGDAQGAPKIKIEWRGEREPLKLRSTQGLSQADIWALNRRVEWVRP